MEKTYKRVPFTIELAKKIQSGEVEGRIVTKVGAPARIIVFNLKNRNKPLAVVSSFDPVSDEEFVREYTVEGKRLDDMDSSIDLVIELPEEAPKHEFKPFDKVLVRANNEMCWKPTFYVLTEITEDNKTFYETIGGVYHEQCIQYEGNEHLVGTTDKPKEE